MRAPGEAVFDRLSQAGGQNRYKHGSQQPSLVVVVPNQGVEACRFGLGASGVGKVVPDWGGKRQSNEVL
jgi:hypothetical protein